MSVLFSAPHLIDLLSYVSLESILICNIAEYYNHYWKTISGKWSFKKTTNNHRQRALNVEMNVLTIQENIHVPLCINPENSKLARLRWRDFFKTRNFIFVNWSRNPSKMIRIENSSFVNKSWIYKTCCKHNKCTVFWLINVHVKSWG